MQAERPRPILSEAAAPLAPVAVPHAIPDDPSMEERLRRRHQVAALWSTGLDAGIGFLLPFTLWLIADSWVAPPHDPTAVSAVWMTLSLGLLSLLSSVVRAWRQRLSEELRGIASRRERWRRSLRAPGL